MSVIRYIYWYSILFLSLNIYSLNLLPNKNKSGEYLDNLLNDKEEFSKFKTYLENNFYTQKDNTKNESASLFIINKYKELYEKLTIYKKLSYKSRKKNYSKKSSKQKKSIKKSLILQNNLLKEIAEQCSEYLRLRKQAGGILFDIIVKKGYRVPNSPAIVPLFFLDSLTAYQHGETCSLMTDEALEPIDNYIKLILDFFTSLIAEKPHLAEYIEPYLLVSLNEKMDDDKIIAYALKTNKDRDILEKSIIHSSKTPTKIDYFVFIKKENGKYIGASLSYTSKDLFWIFSKNNLDQPGIFSKLYVNFEPAKNGLLFTMYGGNLVFYFYRSGKPGVEISEWTKIENKPEDSPRAFALNNRLHKSYNSDLRNTVQFIEFDDVEKLQKIISEIKDAGFLEQSVFLDMIEWLLNHESNTSIAHEIYPSFYPNKLIQQKKHEREELIQRDLIQINQKLKKEFSDDKPQLKSPEVYHDMLKEVLSRKKSIGNRMLQKCVSWWWKAHEKDLKNSRQKGSHIQVEGQKGEATTTLTFPHGPKAKFGLSSKQVEQRLKTH